MESNKQKEKEQERGKEGGESDPNKNKKARPEQARKTKTKVHVDSLEEVDLLSDDDIASAHLGGSSRLRLKKHLEKGIDYIAAKRLVIKENFQKNQQPKRLARTKEGRTTKAADKGNTAQKRPRSEGNTPPTIKKKAKKEPMSFLNALSSVKIAVIEASFPEEQMDRNRLVAVQESISEAHDDIHEEGPQVRFLKCTHKPGHLVMTCADRTSADWLLEVVPTLRPWEGATLRALEGDDLPKTQACTTFIPDERGLRPEADKILHRLRVANHGLNTNLWTVWGKTPSEKGQVWVFSVDQKSLEELKKLDMSPFYKIGRIKFRIRGEQVQKALAEEDEAGPSSAKQPEEVSSPSEESNSSDQGTSPLKRANAQKRAEPMEGVPEEDEDSALSS